MADSGEWLDVVWALVILNKANETQVLSVLDTTFVERLSGRNTSYIFNYYVLIYYCNYH